MNDLDEGQIEKFTWYPPGRLTPRFHGNGFIQVYLNPLTRLHIWSPDFPATRVQNAQIHDHRFWFSSTILLGGLIHNNYDVSTEYSGRHSKVDGVGPDKFPHGLWQQGEGHSDKSTPLEKVHTCRVEVGEVWIYKPGDTYNFGGPGNFHDSRPVNNQLTVTVMTKTKTHPDYRARMVSLNDEEPDHAFENQPDEEEMRLEVRRVMQLLI